MDRAYGSGVLPSIDGYFFYPTKVISSDAPIIVYYQ